MMQTALRTRLMNGTTATLAGTRIDWDGRPQGDSLPAVTLELASETRDKHMAGTQNTRTSRVRAQCWASKPSDAHNLVESIITDLDPAVTQDGIVFLGSFPTILGGLAEDTDFGIVYRQIVDLSIIHTIP